MGGRHKVRRIGTGTFVLLIVLAVLLLGTVGSAFAAMSYDRSRSDLILPGVTIDGIAVGGMTAQQAMAAVRPAVEHRLAGTVTIHAGKQSWTRSLADLGVSADVATAVNQAVAVNDAYPWWSRTYHRIADKPVHASFTVAMSYDAAPAKALVATVARRVRVAGTDASYSLVNGAVHMTKSHPGRALESQARALAAIANAVRAGTGSVALALKPLAPKVPTSDVGKAIVVNVSTNTLYLYDDFKVVRRYRVATAMRGFVTPDGAWEVVNKVENPAWYNPCLGQPGCWAAGEPAVIPPGPGNPLGTRALYLNAPGIRIHGTPSDSSIGSWASHGCIRMHIPESEALYPLVPIGTPAFIVGAPPWGISQNAGPAG